jgi:serine/threonine protein kinase
MSSGRIVVADRFELLSEAGRGAMGSVHRAKDLKTGAQVAVKIVNLERAIDLGRFNREASLLASVQHRNIVGYIAHGATVDNLHFLAQEWVDGINLRTQLRTIGATASEAVTMALGIAEALGAAHAIGVVHRDVKPENIILAGGEPTRIKLVDFGIARFADPSQRLTRTGVMIGTPSYMAPEQARGEGDIGPQADVWALGCVLYEALGGRTPFAGRTPTAIRAKVILDEPPDLAVLCPEAPTALISLVCRMLEKSAAHRPAHGGDAAAALRGLPRIEDGPRRKVGMVEPATMVMPVRPVSPSGQHDAVHPPNPDDVKCLVMFMSVDINPDTITDHDRAVSAAAAKHDLDFHLLDDGSAVLAARQPGKAGAVEAARAALELRAALPDAALSIVGHAPEEPLSDAIDRAAAALDSAAMGALFGDVVAAGSPLHVEPVVIDLVGDEVELDLADLDGPAASEHG